MVSGIPVTVGIGVASFRAGDNGSCLHARADEALYAAMRGRRDQVVRA